MTDEKTGRPWAKLSELQPGDVVRCYGDFTCGIANTERVVGRHHGNGELFVTCSDGYHFLSGQCDDGETVIGVTKA